MMTIYLTEAYKAGDGDPFCAVAGSTLTDAVENTKRYCQDFAELQVETTVLSIEEGAVNAEALARIYNRDCWPALDNTWVMALQQPGKDCKWYAYEVEIDNWLELTVTRPSAPALNSRDVTKASYVAEAYPKLRDIILDPGFQYLAFTVNSDRVVIEYSQPDDDPKFFTKEVSQAYYERLVSEEIPF